MSEPQKGQDGVIVTEAGGNQETRGNVMKQARDWLCLLVFLFERFPVRSCPLFFLRFGCANVQGLDTQGTYQAQD